MRRCIRRGNIQMSGSSARQPLGPLAAVFGISPFDDRLCRFRPFSLQQMNQDEPVSVAAAAGLNARPVRTLCFSPFLNKSSAHLHKLASRDGGSFSVKVKRWNWFLRDSKCVGYDRIKLVTRLGRLCSGAATDLFNSFFGIFFKF